jgi:hypothetical protein
MCDGYRLIATAESVLVISDSIFMEAVHFLD